MRGGRPRGPGHEFLAHAIASETDECLPWPYGMANGSGQLWDGSRVRRVSALVCEAVHGRRPPGAYALHRPAVCSDSSCVNPRHLRWGAIRTGVPIIGHLTRDDLAEIRARLTDGETHVDLAREFEVNRRVIYDIGAGVSQKESVSS